MELIERIDAILPTIKPFNLMPPDFMPLAQELGIPDEWRGKPITSSNALFFLQFKREELNGKN